MSQKRKAKKPRTAANRGRPSVPFNKVKAVARMLAQADRLNQKPEIATIAKKTKLSPTTVQRIRADYRALTLDEAKSHIEIGESLPDVEYKRAERRARTVSKRVHEAIVEGIAEAIQLEDLVDSAPL
jgi:hypothetical protein